MASTYVLVAIIEFGHGEPRVVADAFNDKEKALKKFNEVADQWIDEMDDECESYKRGERKLLISNDEDPSVRSLLQIIETDED